MVDDLANVTQYQVDKARGILKILVGTEIMLHPTDNGLHRYLTAEVSGDYAELLRLVVKNKFGGGHPLPHLFRSTILVTLRLPADPIPMR